MKGQAEMLGNGGGWFREVFGWWPPGKLEEGQGWD